MNRLVIIGNGFDLAHDLPTSYGHFMYDYLNLCCINKQEKKINYNDNFVTINCVFGYSINETELFAIENINNFQDLHRFINRNKQTF